MGIEIVCDQHAAVGVGIARVHQLLGLLDPVASGTFGDNVDPAPPHKRFATEKASDNAAACEFLVAPAGVQMVERQAELLELAGQTATLAC